MHHIQTRYNILHILFWMISCCINGFVAIYLKSKGLDGSLGVVKNIEFKIVAYLPRFFMLVFVKFYASIYRILLYSVL